MKRLLFVLLLASAMISGAAIFADSSSEYVVQSVTGSVVREVSAGKFEPVTEGLVLAPSTVVNTGVNSVLVVKIGDRVATIKAMQKGPVDKLANSALAVAKPGIKLGANASSSDVNAEAGQTRTNVSTASTRASDATKDLQWAEE